MQHRPKREQHRQNRQPDGSHVGRLPIWRDTKDTENRHNRANGQLLAATLDRAFDRGLIGVEKSEKVLVLQHWRESPSQPNRDFSGQFGGMNLSPALRFDPEPPFLERHNGNCFIDALAG